MNTVAKEKEYFVENLVMLTESGMDIVSALEVILGELKIPSMKKTILKLKESVLKGEPISQALEETELFKEHVIALVRLGESSGNFYKNLRVIAVQQRKDRMFQSKLRSAMIYPVFVLSIAAVVGIGVAWFILPNLTNVFRQLNLELPLSTRILVAIGSFLGEHGTVAIPAFLLGLILMLYVMFFASRTKFIGQFLLFHFPGVGTLIKEIELSRLGYIMGTLLEAGVPIVNAITSLTDTASFYVYKKFYGGMREAIESGGTFQAYFASHQKLASSLLPVAVQQMIITGERSGHLQQIYQRVAEMYEEKTEDTSKNITVLLEPFLLFVVWGGVLGVAMAVILPIYSLIGGLNAT